jgi:hypothetical protein
MKELKKRKLKNYNYLKGSKEDPRSSYRLKDL